MKGVILAGGSGTRLYPITKGVSKQALLTSMPTNNGFTFFTSPHGDFRPAGLEIPMITGASATSRIRIIPEQTNAISLTAERAAHTLANSQ